MPLPYPILIAEDNQDDSWLLEHALRQSNLSCSPHFVVDGEDAIDWLKGVGIYADRSRYPLPRLLVTDLKMPKVNGFQLIEWVRSEREFDHIPIVVLSSSDLAHDVERACALGASCCLRKTSRFTQLIQYLRESLVPSEVV